MNFGWRPGAVNEGSDALARLHPPLRDGTLYTGVATDVDRRVREHQAGGPKAAKHVRGRLPVELQYARALGTRADACREEFRIRQLPRAARPGPRRKSPLE